MRSSIRFILIAATMLAGATLPALAQQQAATWSEALPLPLARSEVQAATVNGKIYVAGGGWSESICQYQPEKTRSKRGSAKRFCSVTWSDASTSAAAITPSMSKRN